MPTRRSILPIFLTGAAFVALGFAATNLNDLEVRNADLAASVAVVTDATGVTVTWVTDYDPLLGGQSVVGANLVPTDGAIADDSTIELTIVDSNGVNLGTISSEDGGQTWSGPSEPVAARDSLVASVVIDDRETTSAISTQ